MTSAELTSRAIEFTGAGGLRLVGEEWGDPAARPVLLLHGGGQSRHAWKMTAARLADAGYRALAMDARGHGDSEWSADGDYAMTTFAADVAIILSHLEEPPPVVGASMGGMSALLAQGHADRQLFSTVILVDVTPRMELSGVARIMEFMVANPDGFATLAEAADAISAYNPHRARPRSTAGLERVLREGDDGRWRWQWDPRFITWGRTGDPAELETRMATMADELYRAAGGLSVPTLLVRGAQSELVSDQSVSEFLAAVPHASFVDISGAGHMVAGDDNDAFSLAVTDFLRAHVGVDASHHARLLARERAAAGLRRVGHALLAHEGTAEDLDELAAVATAIAARLEDTEGRDRLAELLARVTPDPAGGGSLQLARHTMVGGVENPFGLEARYRREGSDVVATVTLGVGFEGAPGRAHAGAISALIDETMVAALAAQGITATTASLDLRYLAATPLHVPLTLRARVLPGEGNVRRVSCTASAQGHTFVEAAGTFTPVDLTRLATELGDRGTRLEEDEA